MDKNVSPETRVENPDGHAEAGEWRFFGECSKGEKDVLVKTAPATLDVSVQPQPGQEGKYYVFYRKVQPCVHTQERPQSQLNHHYIIPKKSWSTDERSRAVFMECEEILQRTGTLAEASTLLSPITHKPQLTAIAQRMRMALELITRTGFERMIVGQKFLSDVLPPPYRAMFETELASAYGMLGELLPENLDYGPESDRLYGEALEDIHQDPIRIVGATVFLRMANLEYVRGVLRAEKNLEARPKFQRAAALSDSASEFSREHEPLRAYTLLVKVKCHAALGDDVRLAIAMDELQQSLSSLGEDANQLIRDSAEGVKAGFIPGVPSSVVENVDRLLGNNSGRLVVVTHEVRPAPPNIVIPW